MVIGYTTGVFDMFHLGHLNLLRQAKEQCDYLIVGVSTDELVQHDKHKTPLIPFENRCKIVEAMRYVDRVVPQVEENKFRAWKTLGFHKIFVSSDFKESLQWREYEKEFSEVGVHIISLSLIDEMSSTIFCEKMTKVSGCSNIIGYTTGVFDMFHIGHLNILRRAKEQCDYLIVGVSTDELVQHDKNKTPVIPFLDRCKIVESLKYVDKVVPQKDKNKKRAWEKYKFNKMFVGSDWQGTPQWIKFEKDFYSLGVEFVYLSHTDGISSTILREKISSK